MSANFILIILEQTLGMGSFVWKTDALLLYIVNALRVKDRRLCATLYCERSLWLWYSVRRPMALHLDGFVTVRRPTAVLLFFIVNVLYISTALFEDRNLCCDSGTRFEDRQPYISTALWICSKTDGRTLSTFSRCERPSALLLLLLYITSLAIYWWVHILNIIFLWQGTVNRVNEEGISPCVFQIYSFNATVKMSPVPFWWAIRRLSSMKVLPFFECNIHAKWWPSCMFARAMSPGTQSRSPMSQWKHVVLEVPVMTKCLMQVKMFSTKLLVGNKIVL